MHHQVFALAAYLQPFALGKGHEPKLVNARFKPSDPVLFLRPCNRLLTQGDRGAPREDQPRPAVRAGDKG